LDQFDSSVSTVWVEAYLEAQSFKWDLYAFLQGVPGNARELGSSIPGIQPFPKLLAGIAVTEHRASRGRPLDDLFRRHSREVLSQHVVEGAIMREHDQLPVGELLLQEACQPLSVIGVEGIDHIVKHESSPPVVIGLGPRQHESEAEAVQLRLTHDPLRRCHVMLAIERQMELDLS
jgi:hypothetical protein